MMYEQLNFQDASCSSLKRNRSLNYITYLPTLRCNCNCDMCPQLSLERRSSDEIPPLKMISIIKESTVLSHLPTLNLSGGEIFLLDDIIDFILTMEEIGIICSITSNGFYVDKIGRLLKELKHKSSVVFHISIDGTEDIHNEIRHCIGAYQNAMESVTLIRDNGFKVYVNTVMQDKNYDDLERFKNIVANMQVPHNFIPLTSSTEFHVVFTDDEVKKMLPYIGTNSDRKYILSKGNFRIFNCHAGIQSCAIDPFGNVSTCVSGLYKVDKNNEFFIGSLKEKSFDELWNSDFAENVINKTVKKCAGCFLGCEVPREVIDYGLPVSLSRSDIQPLKHVLSNSSLLGNVSVNTIGWHSLETLSEDITFRWMSESTSSLFLAINDTDSNKKLEIIYMNSLPSGDIMLSVELNDTVIGEIYCNQGMHTIIFPVSIIFSENENVVEVKFKVDKLWSPNLVMGTDDLRKLGIAICSVKLT